MPLRWPTAPSSAKTPPVAAAGATATTADRAKGNSESLLVERRAERLKLLPPLAEPPQVDAPADNPIDQYIVAGWSKFAPQDRPAELCDQATFARRVYLDVTGAIPSLAELNHFLVDSSPQKRVKLIDQLLARKADYAAHWTPFWEDALASQTVLAQGGIPTHGNYRQWLLDSFAENKPYDVMVAELLDPTMPGHKPAEVEDIFGTRTGSSTSATKTTPSRCKRPPTWARCSFPRR